MEENTHQLYEKTEYTSDRCDTRGNGEQPLKENLSLIGPSKISEFNILLHSDSDDETGQKIRTPSGSVIPKTVKSITDYFSQSEKEESDLKRGVKVGQPLKGTNRAKPKAHKVNRNIARKLRTQAKRLVQSGTVNQSSHALETVKVNKHQQLTGHVTLPFEEESDSDQSTDLEGYFTPTEDKKETEFLYQLASQLKMASEEQLQKLGATEDTIESVNGAIKSTEKKSLMVVNQSQCDSLQVDMETNSAPNPQIMGIVSVKEMFEDLRKKMEDGMSALNGQITELKKLQTGQVSDQVIEQFKSDMAAANELMIEGDRKEMVKMKEDLKHFKFRNRALTNIVDNMAQEITELRHRLENVELNGCRNAVTLTGLYLNSNKKNDQILEIESFMDENVGVHVNVEDFYRVGVQEPKMTVIYFQTSQQKRDVLHFKSYLKGLKNRDGKPLFINEYVPAAIQERRKRDRDIFDINNSLETPVEVKYHKGWLTIRGEGYEQKIKPPTPREIVNIDSRDLKRILEMKIAHGGTVTQDGSVFDSYTACVDNYQDIRDLYLKVKLMNPQARHIVCAYWIKGDPFYSQDYCDDDEPSAGRTVLNSMISWKMENRVIFIARKFGGIKMGSSRFECYKQSAMIACKALPWNDKLNIMQNIPSPTTDTPPDDPENSAENSTQPKRPATSPAARGQLSKRPYRGRSGARISSNRGSSIRGARPPNTQNRAQISRQQSELNNIRGSYGPTRGYKRERGGGRWADWDQRYDYHWSRGGDGRFDSNYGDDSVN